MRHFHSTTLKKCNLQANCIDLHTNNDGRCGLRSTPALFCLYVYFYAYIIYDKSVKGSKVMNRLEQIGEISTVGNGVLRTSEVISKGISKTTLAKFLEK